MSDTTTTRTKNWVQKMEIWCSECPGRPDQTQTFSINPVNKKARTTDVRKCRLGGGTFVHPPLVILSQTQENDIRLIIQYEAICILHFNSDFFYFLQ